MKLTKTLVIPVAALLVALGAGAVLATSGPAAAPGGGAAVPPAAESPSPSASAKPNRANFQDPVLTDVLNNLVKNGTITAAQQTAILDGIKAERAQKAADLKAKMDALRAQAQQLKDDLADGVITQDEFNKLPADSPLRKLTTLMDDGKITTDELKSLGQGFGLFGGGFGRGFGGFGRGFGPGFHFDRPNKGGAAPSPSPSSGTSG